MAVTNGKFYRRTLPESCIDFSSIEGRKIFREALATGFMECYFGLAAQFRTQDEPAFCGLSTLVMALNTLEIDPKQTWKGVWRWYDEKMLDCCVPLTLAATNGITMDEFACLAKCNTLNVNMIRATEDASLDDFRSVIKTLTQCVDEVVIASYSRKILGQTGDGHFSPIGGYHEDLDLVLVLDTARFKYPPHWVPLPLLFKAMTMCDQGTDLPRGYFRLRRNDKIRSILFKWDSNLSDTLFDPDVKDHEQNNVEKFFKSWNDFLQGEISSLNQNDVIELSVEKFIQSLALLNKNEYILTCRSDIDCKTSKEHGCLICDLLLEVEKTSIYSVVKRTLEKYPDVISNIGQHPIEGQCNESSNEKEIKLLVQPEHFVTTALLAWQTKICGGIGVSLRRSLEQQLCSSSSKLQDEVSQLAGQLIMMMQHSKKCSC